MTEEKKQALQKILEALIPYWDMAEWFLLILQEEWNNELKEKLYQNIIKEIRNINSKTQQENIKNALQKLKEKTEQTTRADEEDAEKMLDDFINNIQ
jgi:predicted component of type VI protein secretion system